MVRNVTWTLTNMFRGKPQPPWEILSPSISYLSHLLYFKDEEVLQDCFNCLAYLAEGDMEHLTQVISSGIGRNIIKNLSHQSQGVQASTLKVINSIIQTDYSKIEYFIEKGLFPKIVDLLSSENISIVKEACVIVIFSSREKYIQNIISTEIIPKVVNIMKTCKDAILKKHTVWILGHLSTSSTREQIKILAQLGCIIPLCDLLSNLETDDETISSILQIIEVFLKFGASEIDENPYFTTIERCKGFEKIALLTNHNNPDIQNTATLIIDNYINKGNGVEQIVNDTSQMMEYNF